MTVLKRSYKHCPHSSDSKCNVVIRISSFFLEIAEKQPLLEPKYAEEESKLLLFAI